MADDRDKKMLRRMKGAKTGAKIGAEAWQGAGRNLSPASRDVVRSVTSKQGIRPMGNDAGYNKVMGSLPPARARMKKAMSNLHANFQEERMNKMLAQERSPGIRPMANNAGNNNVLQALRGKQPKKGPVQPMKPGRAEAKPAKPAKANPKLTG